MFAQDQKEKVLQEQLKDIILKVKMLLTVIQYHIELQAQQVNANSQEEFSKVRRWLVKWEMKWLLERTYK